VNESAHAGRPPMMSRIRQAWAALSGLGGSGLATRQVRNALARLVAEAPRVSLPVRLRRGIGLTLPYLRLALRAGALTLAALAVAVVMLVVAYRWVNPPISALMLGQSIAGTPIERAWVPLDRVSPHLIRAVVMSEDGRFCEHGGVDWRALQDAIAHDRGGSTITMQVVKNLFLWPSRSYVRKFIEIALAYLVEAVWPKHRILEIYLNIAEWGDGVFGIEAAAHINFSKPAARLTVEEAALLAVALPAPLERSPGLPSAGTNRLAARLMARMSTSRVDLACALSGGSSQTGPHTGPPTKPIPKEKGAPNGDWDHLFPSDN
jgi:monofunctional glycosyltransferase